MVTAESEQLTHRLWEEGAGCKDVIVNQVVLLNTKLFHGYAVDKDALESC